METQDPGRDRALLGLFGAIASGAEPEIARLLADEPGLAIEPIAVGASRQDHARFFLTAIRHHVYAG